MSESNNRNSAAAKILGGMPARRGHFLLESGYHTDQWFSLDALFVDPRALTPQIAALADLIEPHGISAICGPLLGGAFLAHALAAHIGVRFYFSRQAPISNAGGLFAAEYRLPPEFLLSAHGERVAVVDDVISAGSSVRATAAALASAGASTVVVGALLVLGNAAIDHFSDRGVPVVALGRDDFNLWAPANCPACNAGVPVEDPARRGGEGTGPGVRLIPEPGTA
jgi:orotate phosphoribosyltransferase